MNINPTSRRPDWAALGVAAVLTVFAFVIFWDTARLSGTAGYSQVGPATVPRWIAGAMLILAGLTAISAIRGTVEKTQTIHDPVAVLWVIGGLLLQIALLKSAGFTIATGLMFAFVARGFGERRWHISLPVGLALSFFVFAVFSQVLNLSLPAGWLEQLFF